MECPACSLPNRTGAVFCRDCGTSLAVDTDARCASCGAESAPGAQFCDRCGEALAASARPASMRARLSARAAERRLVTVLFADAKGSTALTERVGDEEMYRLIQGCVTRMQAVVEANDGTVTQFRGDGIMALFGAPVAVENAAVKAVTAALEMQEALHRYGEELRQRTGASCPFRIGVNTGPVVVGRMGEETLVDYTAIGDTANVAARLEQAAGDGEVLVSDATWRSIRDFVECEEAGVLELKGKHEGVTAHRALRRRPVRDRLDAMAARGLARFVGRDDELALLLGIVHRLTVDADGQGRVVTVSGEAGIGKSRLLRELHHRLPAGVDWFEGRSSAADRRTPWHLVVDLLRRTFGVAEEHTHADVGRLVDEVAAGWSAAARPSARYLRWLLGVPTPELEGIDPQELRAGIVEALVAVLRDAATRRPAVVTLEDLHWADESSRAVVAALAAAVVDMPVLVVATHRPEGPPDLGDQRGLTRLVLAGLAQDALGELASVSVGAELTESAHDLIVERTGGNPLFVEELTASLVETGALIVRDGRLELAPDADRSAIPESLHDVVLTRIDRLDEEARRALQLASVIGREFTRRILDRIAQIPAGLDDHLAELESLELIRQRSWFPELSYLFKHAVVHDVTYSTLLDDRRRALHRLVAEATEDLYAETIGDHCDALARHWIAAADERRALPHLIEAAHRALAGFALPRAIEAFDHGADIAERLGELPTALALREELLNALLAASDVDGMIAESDRVVALARRAGDVCSEATAMGMRSIAEFWAHDFDAALAHSRAGYELVAPATRSATAGQHAANAALLCCQAEAITNAVLGRLDETDASFARGEEHAGRTSPVSFGSWAQITALRDNWRGRWSAEPAAMTVVDAAPLADRILILWTAGLHHAGMGDYGPALERLHEGLTLCERTGEILGRARILNTIGWIHGDLGDADSARAYNERSIATTAPVDLPDREIEANALLNLTDSALLAGDLAEGARHLDALERTVRDPTPPEVWMLWRYGQRWRCASGELVLAAGGDPAEALALADECLDIAEPTNSPKYVVRARRLRGQALAEAGRPDEATEELDASLVGARALGNPPQLWRSLTARARLPEGAALASEAVDVIDDVARGLGDHPLARTLRDGSERAAAVALLDP